MPGCTGPSPGPPEEHTAFLGKASPQGLAAKGEAPRPCGVRRHSGRWGWGDRRFCSADGGMLLGRVPQPPPSSRALATPSFLVLQSSGQTSLRRLPASPPLPAVRPPHRPRLSGGSLPPACGARPPGGSEGRCGGAARRPGGPPRAGSEGAVAAVWLVMSVFSRCRSSFCPRGRMPCGPS